jgi:hypothetical protein
MQASVLFFILLGCSVGLNVFAFRQISRFKNLAAKWGQLYHDMNVHASVNAKECADLVQKLNTVIDEFQKRSKKNESQKLKPYKR